MTAMAFCSITNHPGAGKSLSPAKSPEPPRASKWACKTVSFLGIWKHNATGDMPVTTWTQIDPPKYVLGTVLFVAKTDGADKINKFTKTVLIKSGTGKVLGEDAFKAEIVTFNGNHGIIHDFADSGLFSAILKIGPTRSRRNPKNVFGFVFVLVFGIGTGVFALTRDQFGVVFLKSVGDVFEENETKDDIACRLLPTANCSLATLHSTPFYGGVTLLSRSSSDT